MRRIFFVKGVILIALSFFMIPPSIVDLIEKSSGKYVFFASFFITFASGLFFFKVGKAAKLERKHILFITAYNWIFAIIFASLPFKMYGISFIDSFFEATSGITTTGATVLLNLQTYSKGILLWRAILHFIGGLGIIIFAISFFPIIKGISAQKLFYGEFSDKSEKIFPRSSHTAFFVMCIYCSLILLCTLSYNFFGMNFFDSVCHAISTISTGGFTNYDDSFVHYKNQSLQRIAVFFMLLSALPFTWYLKMIIFKKPFFDEQAFWFLCTLLVITIVSVASIWKFEQLDLKTDTLNTVERSLFSITSVMTTTGFVNADYSFWMPNFTGLAIFFLMFFGGCTGSTAGGFKFFRAIILLKNVKKEIIKIIKPMQVEVIKFNGCIIENHIVRAISSLLILNLSVFIASSLIVSLSGLDYITSMTAVTASLTNSGPGLGEIVGPFGNYFGLTTITKCVLITDMLLGRLEVIAVLTFLICMLKMKISWSD